MDWHSGYRQPYLLNHMLKPKFSRYAILLSAVAWLSQANVSLPAETLPAETLPAETLPAETLPAETLPAKTWTVPVAGNAYLAEPDGGKRLFTRVGTMNLTDPGRVFSIYVRFDRPTTVGVSVRGRADQGAAKLVMRAGDQSLTTEIENQSFSESSLGEIKVARTGYQRFDCWLSPESKHSGIELSDLILEPSDDAVTLDFVKTNTGNMFYWGRRGPSVHLRYEVPDKVDLRYCYSEVRVPKGKDTIGSFFMANGFGEGYFGFQVNGESERRILFSVWSPFRTDNPKDVPAADRIKLLAKGEGVRAGKFGNEGSGGQSYRIYPWKAGVTYRFLTEVIPQKGGSTRYTAWFGALPEQNVPEQDLDGQFADALDDWQLIASFQRPKTQTHLRGFHSFLENFSPAFGHIGRAALYGNVWVVDTEGSWFECTNARFSVDATGRGKHRFDFAGGTDGDSFMLTNCGFFDRTTKPGQQFVRPSSGDRKPAIDFAKLPRE